MVTSILQMEKLNSGKGKSSAGTLSRTREIPALEKSVSESQKELNDININIEEYSV